MLKSILTLLKIILIIKTVIIKINKIFNINNNNNEIKIIIIQNHLLENIKAVLILILKKM